MISTIKLAPFFVKFIQQSEYENNGFFQDMHIHTPASDGFIKIDFLKQFLENKKYLIAVTDHNAIAGNLSLFQSGISVIPALELGCQDGFELLVYFKTHDALVQFYEREVNPYQNIFRMSKTNRHIFEYLEILKEYPSHLSIPHIAGYMQKNFLENKTYIYELISIVDSLEIHNHSLSETKNKKASYLQEKYQKFATFGSDAHSVAELKRFYDACNQQETQFSKFMSSLWKASSLAGIGEKHLMHFVMSYKNIIS